MVSTKHSPDSVLVLERASFLRSELPLFLNLLNEIHYGLHLSVLFRRANAEMADASSVEGLSPAWFPASGVLGFTSAKEDPFH